MKDKEKNFVSAVIYVHNAASRAGSFLQTVAGILAENFEHAEIICVNDSSSDDSLGALRSASAAVSAVSVSVVNMSYFHGLEVAMNAGVDFAIGDFVFEFDSPVWDFEKDEIMNTYQESISGGGMTL